MKLKNCIALSLVIGAVFTAVLAAAGFLWWLLAANGDDGGAQGARGVTLVAALCWSLNFVWLVVLLALAQLSSSHQDATDEISP